MKASNASRKDGRPKSGGITLLEVLIYVTLFSFCFSTLGQISISSQKMVQKINAEKEALMVDMLVHAFAQNHARGKGAFVDEESVKDFLGRILVRRDTTRRELIGSFEAWAFRSSCVFFRPR